MPRWHLACDHCDAGAWVGPSEAGLDAWCESCQSAHALSADAGADAACPDCGMSLSFRALRFVDLRCGLRSVAAVLAAWDGDAAVLGGILPEHALRAAEQGLGFDAFRDRAPVLLGYATRGMKPEASALAAELATGMLSQLSHEPYLRSPPAASLAAAVLRAAQFTGDGVPGEALREVRALMERPDVGRHRVPCGRCGAGSIGVDGVEEDEADG